MLVLCAAILVVAAGMTLLIFTTEPSEQRSGATKETAMLVEVTGVEHGNFHPIIRATGSVQPAQDVSLSARVGGRVTAHAPEFVPGGFVEQGEVLVRIDSADYRNALEQQRGALAQAEADLTIELGQQAIARQEYRQLFTEKLPPDEEALVLRQPQLAAAKTRVAAARAAVAQAELDLARTHVKAPFTAQVLSREVNVGSEVAAGDPLARLAGVETYWVQAAVPLAKRRWLSFSNDGDTGQGSEVRIRNAATWAPGAYRAGHLFKLIGALDEATRLARVLISVPDPLGRQNGASDQQPALMIGEFVEVSIRGKQISNVVRLQRDYVRKGDTAWVMAGDELAIKKLEIVMRDSSYAYISRGLNPDDRVVTTNLATVAEGAKLRLAPSEPTE